MADKKTSELTSATSLTGNEFFALVQSGSDRKVTVNVVRDTLVTSNNIVTALGFTPMDSSVLGDIETILNEINGE